MGVFKRLLLSDSHGTTSAHRDTSRQLVGSTAFAVAAFRAAESSSEAPLVIDAVATAVFALNGPAPLRWRLLVAAFSWKRVLRLLFCHRRLTKFEIMADMLAYRTAYLDAEITAAAPQQLVTVGAGLDARSIRLGGRDERRWFDVDFASMHSAKWQLFAAAGFAQPDSLVCVDADLTDPGAWQRELLAAHGFSSGAPTLWLLEGLTGYLERDELILLLAQITELSAPGSVILATFISATRPEGSLMSGGNTLKMHKFFTDTPEVLFNDFAAGSGSAVDVVTIGQLEQRFRRRSIDSADASYKFVRAVRGGAR